MPPTSGILSWVVTDHAAVQLLRRGISPAVLASVLRRPEQRFSERRGRDVFQARVSGGRGTFLVRVFVDVATDPPEVVTAYRTSKIEKYWRRDS